MFALKPYSPIMSLLIFLILPIQVIAQSPESYPMAQGGMIILPSGPISFADRVINFEEGNPASNQQIERNPSSALGPPDWKKGAAGYTLTLGCRGSVVVEFVDNALIDVEGPDLHVWEVGDDIEPTELSISRNGVDWIGVGVISGGTASVDIRDYADVKANYRFVKLTDVNCMSRGGRWPGADIDALAAVGSAQRIVFDSGVLFDSGEAVLTEEAKAVLSRFADQFKNKQISYLQVDGHTDSKGSNLFNLELSERRAASVSDFLNEVTSMSSVVIETHGLGETEPVASNDSDAGRKQNRRVEIIVVPKTE